MIFGILNPTKIWHICPPHISHVATLPWEIEKVIFNSIIHRDAPTNTAIVLSFVDVSGFVSKLQDRKFERLSNFASSAAENINRYNHDSF